MTYRPNRWHPMPAHVLRSGLAALGLNLSEFARCIGGQQRRVERWCRGQEDIPHYVRALLLLMLDDKKNVERLRAISDANRVKTSPQISPPISENDSEVAR